MTVAPGSDNQQLDVAAPELTVPKRAEPEAVNAEREDPEELWKQVRNGNPGAEARLAKLYVEGTGVPQNCEQARLLLMASLKKGSKAASGLLTGSYAQRCP